MADVILAMSIGVNIPKWKERAQAVKSDYREGQLGGIEVYFPPVGAHKFDFEDIRTLREMLNIEINHSQHPLYVGGHLAHRAHGFHLVDGLTEQNINCIDTAIEGVKVMNARHLVVHAGGKIPGREMNRGTARRVFDYLKSKMNGLDCAIVIENMYQAPDDEREPLYCRIDGDKTSINQIGREYGFRGCFDWTHLALYLWKALEGRNYLIRQFAERYCDEAMAFLNENPRVLHVSTFKPGYQEDQYGFFTEFNRQQLRAVALFTNFMSDESLPTVIETRYNRWARNVDKKNLDIAMEEVARYWSRDITMVAAQEKIKQILRSV